MVLPEKNCCLRRVTRKRSQNPLYLLWLFSTPLHENIPFSLAIIVDMDQLHLKKHQLPWTNQQFFWQKIFYVKFCPKWYQKSKNLFLSFYCTWISNAHDPITLYITCTSPQSSLVKLKCKIIFSMPCYTVSKRWQMSVIP